MEGRRGKRRPFFALCALSGVVLAVEIVAVMVEMVVIAATKGERERGEAR